ncbi:hypothetical protein [Sorangium sp. So ce426]|uniref:hypothetical protein n=1 Tax=unclassified Sorangium TaxID=2621164 RepID=UPI003F5BF287
MEKLVIGLVQTHDDAEAAAERIIDCGYTRQEVSLLMTEATRDRCFPSPDVAPPSSTFGAAVSMSVVVPDLGFVVAGPLAAVVASAVGAGITGGLREILLTAGVPRHWAERYEAGVRQGGILVSVFARSERDVGLLHLVLDDPHMTSFHTEAHRHHAYDTSF